jgi:hypothetical protein
MNKKFHLNRWINETFVSQEFNCRCYFRVLLQYSRMAIIFIFVTVSVTILMIPIHSCYAHIVDSKNIQVWKNPKNDMKIGFAYNPEKPIIDTFTNLQFSVTDLETDEHIKDLVAQVTVTNGQRLFKFQNISVLNGDFSVDYLFPDDGTHQVLLRIDKNDSISVASFNVFVPHQSPPNILDNQGNLIIGMGILAAVGAITIVILKKK